MRYGNESPHKDRRIEVCVCVCVCVCVVYQVSEEGSLSYAAQHSVSVMEDRHHLQDVCISGSNLHCQSPLITQNMNLKHTRGCSVVLLVIIQPPLLCIIAYIIFSIPLFSPVQQHTYSLQAPRSTSGKNQTV